VRGARFIPLVGQPRARSAANDLPGDQLQRLLQLTPYPATLEEIVNTSRARFGWFTKQEARSLEYPWLVEHAGDVAGRSVIDIGAGVSPVPLVLAQRGALVTTIDYMPADVRELDVRNEWGFLDYHMVDPRITSINADATTVELDAGSGDVIASISVIEHMPASVRRLVLHRAGVWARAGGRLLLTVDLRPNSNDLWNLDRGQVVEPAADHGTLPQLEKEVHGAGFDVSRVEVLRWASSTIRTDLAFLIAIRRGSEAE
jgi:cyclopropane fatty-acyl-phospholipid synthase-like methyltransferase